MESAEQSPVVVPDIGAGTGVVRLVSWLIQEGEQISAGERLVEITAHGVCFSIPADRDGQLMTILRRTGSEVQVDDVLGWIGPSEQNANDPREG